MARRRLYLYRTRGVGEEAHSAPGFLRVGLRAAAPAAPWHFTALIDLQQLPPSCTNCVYELRHSWTNCGIRERTACTNCGIRERTAVESARRVVQNVSPAEMWRLTDNSCSVLRGNLTLREGAESLQLSFTTGEARTDVWQPLQLRQPSQPPGPSHSGSPGPVRY